MSIKQYLLLSILFSCVNNVQSTSLQELENEYQYCLGMRYYQNRGKAGFYDESIKCLELAATNDHFGAQIALSDIYFEYDSFLTGQEKSVEIDLEWFFNICCILAEKHYPNAVANVVYMFQNKIGRPLEPGNTQEYESKGSRITDCKNNCPNFYDPKSKLQILSENKNSYFKVLINYMPDEALARFRQVSKSQNNIAFELSKRKSAFVRRNWPHFYAIENTSVFDIDCLLEILFFTYLPARDLNQLSYVSKNLNKKNLEAKKILGIEAHILFLTKGLESAQNFMKDNNIRSVFDHFPHWISQDLLHIIEPKNSLNLYPRPKHFLCSDLLKIQSNSEFSCKNRKNDYEKKLLELLNLEKENFEKPHTAHFSILIPKDLKEISNFLLEKDIEQYLTSILKDPNLNISAQYIQEIVFEAMKKHCSIDLAFSTIDRITNFLVKNTHPYARYLELFTLSLTESDEKICSFVKIHRLPI